MTQKSASDGSVLAHVYLRTRGVEVSVYSEKFTEDGGHFLSRFKKEMARKLKE
jgi:hypothetical protein